MYTIATRIAERNSEALFEGGTLIVYGSLLSFGTLVAHGSL
jgi:hypothetical protein